jgi:hypothetical protein
MDVENRPFDVVMGVQNGGDVYSVYIRKEGDPARINLFQGFVADRDAVTCDAILGCPIPPLTHLFFCANDQVTPQVANGVLFDDFFLSASGFNSTTPTPPSSFLEPLRVIQFAFDGALDVTLTWNTNPGQTYTVEKRFTLGSGTWETVVTDYPVGGATEATVSLIEGFDPSKGAVFYRVSSP